MLVPFFAKARSKCQSHIRKGDTARITIKNYWAFTYGVLCSESDMYHGDRNCNQSIISSPLSAGT